MNHQQLSFIPGAKGMQEAPQQKEKIACHVDSKQHERKIQKLEREKVELANELRDTRQQYKDELGALRDEVNGLQQRNVRLTLRANQNGVELNRANKQDAMLKKTMDEDSVKHQNQRFQLDMQISSNVNLKKRLSKVEINIGGLEIAHDSLAGALQPSIRSATEPEDISSSNQRKRQRRDSSNV
ncbi:hypothetical protein BLS_001211 [Venturia inaequalis]|uniref:Uncharacterized protein n=1 Tax=Venturia inaequalis TaxID=5025 RepID=A0A8H3UUY8_VENIN|nr:hypothetical protein BLS_001211 [Venturia inaequalis]